MEKIFQFKMSESLYSQLEKHIEIHEKRTGIRLTMSDIVRSAISEKLLKGGK